MRGGRVRRHRLRMTVGHPHPVHDHRGVMGPGGVEQEVQTALGDEGHAADARQRPLTAAQQTRAQEHRYEPGNLGPHRRGSARGQGMATGGEQHAQHGEHRRAHAPHCQGHTHGGRCCHVSRASLP